MSSLPTAMLPLASRNEVFVAYLDYFRSQILDKVIRMPASEQERSALPSGWTPLELVNHLTHVEMRWLQWGFEGRSVPDPWADQRDGRWYVATGETPAEVLAALRAQGEQSRAIVMSNDLETVGQPGPRWDGGDPPTLERILFHLFQEYARHLGHLDIVSEIATGAVGE